MCLSRCWFAYWIFWLFFMPSPVCKILPRNGYTLLKSCPVPHTLKIHPNSLFAAGGFEYSGEANVRSELRVCVCVCVWLPLYAANELTYDVTRSSLSSSRLGLHEASRWSSLRVRVRLSLSRYCQAISQSVTRSVERTDGLVSVIVGRTVVVETDARGRYYRASFDVADVCRALGAQPALRALPYSTVIQSSTFIVWRWKTNSFAKQPSVLTFVTLYFLMSMTGLVCHYVRQGSYVFTRVCLSVCLSVCLPAC